MDLVRRCSECSDTFTRHGRAVTCTSRCARVRKTRKEREARAALVMDRARPWLTFGLPREAAITLARAGVAPA